VRSGVFMATTHTFEARRADTGISPEANVPVLRT